ncbi:unnamed protein product [Rhizophagus irregularis]|nr:unnamed protein product [Rhizophagus irregularis]
METITEEEENAEIYITKHMTVKTILHLLTPLEYPPTSENGVAIIYHVEGWQNVDSAFTDIQYSMGEPSGQNQTTCSYFGDITVNKKDRTCRGLKICEFASPELLEMTHKSVDPNSDLCLKMSKELLDNNLENNTFTGLYKGKTNEPVNNCFTVLHNNSKKKLCPHPHRSGNVIKQGLIIQKSCGVKYSKLIPLDLNKCPYIILVSRGIHSHSPPPPSRVPISIHNRLQELINQANSDTIDVNPTYILTGNLIKTYFGIEYLAEVHASLNNADHLRYYVDKIQKEIHPQGHELLGVIYNYSQNIDNFCEYVKRLEFFEDSHVMIICTTSEQLSEWMKCDHFQIDLSFKHIVGEMNKFEVNHYSNQHNLILTFARIFTNHATIVAYQRIFKALFDLIYQLTGLTLKFNHIHKTGWSCIIADLDIAQAKGLGIVLNDIDRTKSWEEHLIHIFKSCKVHYQRQVFYFIVQWLISNMLALLTAESENEINQLFENIKTDENTADWVAFYQQKWVIGSLNKCMSKINNEIWITAPDNTNTAEAAYALSNRRGKNLKIVIAILQGRKLDKERFTAIHIHQKYNVPYRGCDKGLIARNIQSNKRCNNQKYNKIE